MKINTHVPVMEKEVIAGLNIEPEGIYIDATFGRGGHTKAILKELKPKGLVVVIDKDPDAIKSAKELQIHDNRVRIYHGSYSDVLQFCESENIVGRVDGIVLDLGVSSTQLDEGDRGFSFTKDGPLDMRMDTTKGFSAAEWLTSANEDEISNVLKTYGEERYAKKIANAICKARLKKQITTTKELADLITNIYPGRYKLKKHPATRSFQGIRIFVNNELDDLKQALESIVKILNSGGRLVVISFHSLEDRIVKRFINSKFREEDLFLLRLPMVVSNFQPTLKKIAKRKPTDNEIKENIRARSAILRVAEKLQVIH